MPQIALAKYRRSSFFEKPASCESFFNRTSTRRFTPAFFSNVKNVSADFLVKPIVKIFTRGRSEGLTHIPVNRISPPESSIEWRERDIPFLSAGPERERLTGGLDARIRRVTGGAKGRNSDRMFTDGWTLRTSDQVGRQRHGSEIAGQHQRAIKNRLHSRIVRHLLDVQAHRQPQCHMVSCLPGPCQGEITARACGAFHRPAVDFHRCPRGCPIWDAQP